MNIDLRNIDFVFEEDLKRIMQEKEIATASKAVRYAVTNSRIKDLKIDSLQKENAKMSIRLRDLEEAQRRVSEAVNLLLSYKTT